MNKYGGSDGDSFIVRGGATSERSFMTTNIKRAESEVDDYGSEYSSGGIVRVGGRSDAGSETQSETSVRYNQS